MEHPATCTPTEENVQAHPTQTGIDATDACTAPRRSRPLVRVFIITVVFSAVSGLIAGAGFPIYVEAGPFEQFQAILWGLIAAVAMFLAIRQTRGPDLAAMILFSVLAVAACAREFDAHVHLNPEALGPLGVRFRSRWWLDPEVSLMLKLGWLLIAATAMALILVPLWFSRGPLIRAVVRREPMAWCFGAVGLLFVFSVVCDDLLRYRVPLSVTQPTEELAETLAPVAYFLAILVFHHSASKGWKVEAPATAEAAVATADSAQDTVETPAPSIDTTGARHVQEASATQV